MKKNIFGKKLGRDKNERKALFRGLMSALILEDRIKTSEAKARAIRSQIEKLVTKAKKGGNSSQAILNKSLTKDAVLRITRDIAPVFANRHGGYTRLTKLGRRLGDNTSMVIIEWTEVITRTPVVKEAKVKKEVKTKEKTVVKKKKSAPRKNTKKTVKK